MSTLPIVPPSSEVQKTPVSNLLFTNLTVNNNIHVSWRWTIEAILAFSCPLASVRVGSTPLYSSNFACIYTSARLFYFINFCLLFQLNSNCNSVFSLFFQPIILKLHEVFSPCNVGENASKASRSLNKLRTTPMKPKTRRSKRNTGARWPLGPQLRKFRPKLVLQPKQ